METSTDTTTTSERFHVRTPGGRHSRKCWCYHEGRSKAEVITNTDTTTKIYKERARVSRNCSQRLYRKARQMDRNAANARQNGYDDVADTYEEIAAGHRASARHEAANARFWAQAAKTRFL